MILKIITSNVTCLDQVKHGSNGTGHAHRRKIKYGTGSNTEQFYLVVFYAGWSN